MDRPGTSRHDDVLILERLLVDENADPINLPLSLLERITNGFSIGHQIGIGGFAVVYKGIVGKWLVAVKQLFSTFIHENKFHGEVRCLMKAKHENIVRFLGYCAETKGKMENYEGKFVMADQRNWLLCFEYVPHGSLDKHITDASNGLEWRERYCIIRGICEGIHYLHKECILHLDLKPANILLDDHMIPKIADFGISRCFDEGQTSVITEHICGSLGYFAPERLRGQITFKSDIFSLGVVIVEIVTGDRSYPEDEKVVARWMDRLEALEGDTQLEQVRVCIKIGMECMDLDPSKRPAPGDIIDKLDKMGSVNYSDKTGASSPSVEQIKVQLHNIPDEGESSTARVARSDKANKHHVLESMLCDESVKPTCLELSLLEDITNNFSSDREIARSRLGVVYKGKLSNGSTVAVKRLAITTAIDDKLFIHVVQSLMSVKHNNIVRFLGYCAITQVKEVREGGKTVMVIVRERLLCFEYLCNGNLQMHLTALCGDDEAYGFDWHTSYQTIKRICQGLHYLHDGCIAHLDLKPDNILFDEKMVPKILDYGFSRVFSEEIRQTVLKIIDGSLAFMATPEYSAGGEITLKSDIYNLGLIIMQIVTGQNNKNYSNIASIAESWRSRLELDTLKGGHTFETCYQQVQICIEIGIRCMDNDPGNRPSTQYIINRLHKTETERLVSSYGSNSPSPRATRPLQSADVKVVLKVPMTSKKSKAHTMKIVSNIEGIKSIGYDEDKSTLTVVGNVDVVVIVRALRKAKHHAQVITVGGAEKVEEKSTIDNIPIYDQESDSCTIM